MKLISLKLLHYRRFRQEEIIFKDDFSLIFGKNGAGKSSILDAIGYSLFGPTSKDFVRVNRSYLKSYFLTDREPSKIELTFQYGLDTYRIIRIIDAGTKKFATDFIIENKDILYGPNNLEIIGGDEITDYISSLIGVNKETFLRSVFARQKDLEVLSGGLSERKELINKVLGLDRIENIISNFKSEEKDKKTTLEFYKKRVSEFDEESLKTKKDEFSIKLKEVLERLKKLELEQKELGEIYKNSKNDFDKISDKKNKFTQFNQDFLLKKQQYINIKENIEEKNNLLSDIIKKEKFLEENKQIIIKEQELKKSLLEMENQKSKFKQKEELEKELLQNTIIFEDLQKKIQQYSNDDIKKDLQRNSDEIEKLNTNIKELSSQKSSLESELNQIKKSGEETKKELENIEKIGKDSPCPTCKRPLDEQYPNLVSLFNKDLLSKREEYKTKNEILLNILSQIKSKEEELEKVKLTLKSLEQKEKESLVFNEKFKNTNKDILIIKEKITGFKDINYSLEFHEKLKKEYEEVNLKFQEYNKIIGQVSQKESIINFISVQKYEFSKNDILLKDLESKILELNFKIEDFENIKKTYDEINSKINAKNIEVNENQKNKLDIEFELEKLKAKETDFKDDKKAIDNLVLEVDNLALKKQIMSDYITYLLEYMKPRIEDLASEYFSVITDYKYTTISLDEDYNIMIDSKNLNLYSGGEIDLANLCLRLSLGQNLTSLKGNPINFLILDEVLASQDKDRQENILINLKKLENKFSQIILISHLEEIKDLATNLIEIKALNREESVVNYY